MAASVLTFFLNNPIQSGSSAGLLDLTQPATSTSTTGWIVGKIASGTFSRQSYNQKLPTTAFAGITQPSGAPITLAGHLAEDCWRTSNVTSGNFSAGTWYSSGSVIAVTIASSQAGALHFRAWHTPNVDGTAAVEFTKGGMVGTTVALSTTVAASSSASTQVASSTITNEYIFLSAAWAITTAGGSNSADVLYRMGAITSNVAGSFLATSAFSIIVPAAGTASGAGYWNRAQDWLDA